jgi:phage terminase small subunit
MGRTACKCPMAGFQTSTSKGLALTKKPTPPASLGRAGKKLFRVVIAAVPDTFELDEREREILTLAGQQADDLGRLERAIKRDGVMAEGSKGQAVVNPAISEARHARLAIGRLLGSIRSATRPPDTPVRTQVVAASARRGRVGDSRAGRLHEASHRSRTHLAASVEAGLVSYAHSRGSGER